MKILLFLILIVFLFILLQPKDCSYWECEKNNPKCLVSNSKKENNSFSNTPIEIQYVKDIMKLF